MGTEEALAVLNHYRSHTYATVMEAVSVVSNALRCSSDRVVDAVKKERQSIAAACRERAHDTDDSPHDPDGMNTWACGVRSGLWWAATHVERREWKDTQKEAPDGK